MWQELAVVALIAVNLLATIAAVSIWSLDADGRTEGRTRLDDRRTRPADDGLHTRA